VTAYLELSRISRDFGGVSALVDIDLSLAPGEIHCLVGENGSASRRSSGSFPASSVPSLAASSESTAWRPGRLTPSESTRLGIQ